MYLLKGTTGRGQKTPKEQQQQQQQRMFTVNKVPGFGVQMRRESLNKSASGSSFSGSSLKHVDNSPVRTRDNSPKMPRPRSEEIPLEDMRLRKTSLTSNVSNSSGASDHHKDITGVAQSSMPNNGAEIPTRKRGSEETSFTERHIHESRPRRKGQVETV